VDLARVAHLVRPRDRGGVRASLRQTRLQALPGPVVLPRAVVVDTVVEAPEREAEGKVVEPARQVRRELSLQLGADEGAVRNELERRPARHRLRLGILGYQRALGV